MARRVTNIIKNYKTGELFSESGFKSYIMRVYGWTARQYKSERQKVQNRLRNYETLTGQKAPLNASEYLIQKYKTNKRYGQDSQLIKEIDAISSASTKEFKKTRQRAQEKEKQIIRSANATGKEPRRRSQQPGNVTEKAYVQKLKVRWAGVMKKKPESPVAGFFEDYDTYKMTLKQLVEELEKYGESLNTRRAGAGYGAGGTKNAIHYE